MFDPIEMFRAQGGAGMQAMARQFGLSPEQAARALEALMPALALGIQRGAGPDPGGFARMFGMPETARAAAPQGLDALGQMFGSAQLMQAVLQQASSASGVGAQVLRQMLPMMAGAVVASIVHVLLNQPQAEAAPAAPPPPAAFPFGPWAEMAKAFMPGAEPPQVRAGPSAPPRPAGPPEPQPGQAGSDMLRQMLRTGAEVQGQNIKAMQELFEAFWPVPGKAEAPEPAPAEDARPRDARAPTPGPPAPKPRRGRPAEGGTR